MSEKFLDPIKRTRISEQVADRLENLIRDRKLSIGEQLPSERQLMEMLGVGRGAIREALRILEIKGYVEIKQGIGAFVRNFEGDFNLPLSTWLIDQKDLLGNFFEIRLMIEPEAAAIAARRITKKELSELKKVHREFTTQVEAGELSEAIIADAKFHKLLAEATHNKLLAVTMDTIRRSVIVGWKAPLRVPGRMEKTIDEHQAILSALEAGDGEQAAEMSRRHLEEAIIELKEEGLAVDD